MKKIYILIIALFIQLTSHAQSWTMQNVGFFTPGADPFQISVVDANVAWASAGNGLLSSYNNEVSHTTDGGNAWHCSRITSNASGLRNFFHRRY